MLNHPLNSSIFACFFSLHKRGKINWQDPNYALPNHRKYRASEAFSQSKLANVLFTRELARRLDGTGVNAYVQFFIHWEPEYRTLNYQKHLNTFFVPHSLFYFS